MSSHRIPDNSNNHTTSTSRGADLDDVDSLSGTSSMSSSGHPYSGMSGGGMAETGGHRPPPATGGLQSLLMAAHASAHLQPLTNHPTSSSSPLSPARAPTSSMSSALSLLGGKESARSQSGSFPEPPGGQPSSFAALLEAYRLQEQPSPCPPYPTPASSGPPSSLPALTLLEAFRQQHQQQDQLLPPNPSSGPPGFSGGPQGHSLFDAMRMQEYGASNPLAPLGPPGMSSASSSMSSYARGGLATSPSDHPLISHADFSLGMRSREESFEDPYPPKKMRMHEGGGGGEERERRKSSGEREHLGSLTAEEKLERRKERARMYSHIARKRQENLLKDLKAEVESLSLYRLLIEESPDMIAVLSPDVESRFLFANAAFARLLHTMPSTLLGSSLWDIMHPDDHPAVMEVLRSIIMATQTTKSVRCRIKNVYVDKYVPVDVTLRCGRQGIIYFLRLQSENT